MRFSDVIGHNEIKERLRRAVDQGRVSHAQLFTGECGGGALPMALAYAQYINCTNRHDGDSCGECPSCRKMEEMAHPDLHFVFPVNKQGKKSGEKVMSGDFLQPWREQIRSTGGYFDESMWNDRLDLGKTLKPLISVHDAGEIIRTLSFKSFEGEYKIVLVWLPELMNVEAANTLLKILEEPWEKTLFLMVSRQPQRLLSTIISRTQEVAVPRIDSGELAEELVRESGLERERADQLARLACGDLIEARRLVGGGDQMAAASFDMFCSLMRLSYSNKHLELLDWAEGFAALTRDRQIAFFGDALRLLRESYMLNAGMAEISYLWAEEAAFCSKFAPFVGNHNIEALVAEIETARGQIVQNGNALIVATHFALAISKLIVKI
ncbi:MAG: DNA polymerase III subunit [Rikenellaceae bacterium]|nr:DNA polymerase III subunit [Rikenellaceae bacterium]MBR3800932.1 DNA polymerase III subunit [Rikenellaceae bacterium]